MNIKEYDIVRKYNIAIAEWQTAIHDVRHGNRDSFIAVVKEGGGDHYYAKDCTDNEAITQIRMAIEEIQYFKKDEMEKLEA